MKNEIQLFQSQEFGQIRVVEVEGNPWFVALDVCRALDIQNHKDAIKRLDDDEKMGVVLTDPHGRPQDTNCINEPGLYSLVLGSRKPEAKAFKRWITHEVLPAIRKTGGYIAGENELSDDELIARALTVAHKKLAEREKRIASLEKEKQELKPKADYFDELVFRETNFNFRDSAKELDVKPAEFIRFLIENKYIYRDKSGKLRPYESRVEQGLFVLKECYSTFNNWSGSQTLVTPKGRATFRILMNPIRRTQKRRK